ncbi:ISLre2 family transposase, partial [Lactococcus taiwanensis]|uniref:ISLre2 family transposase n=1 Tax=Lactococcus taiwanensis TaxID=1151742 RepID=UPI0035158F3D
MNFESTFEKECRRISQHKFLKKIKTYDDEVLPKMRKAGWIPKGFKERTISFTSGTYTFERRFYVRNGEYCVPVDEHFGFEKGQRLSKELRNKIVKLALESTYRGVCRIIWELYHVDISIWTVHQTVVQAEKLLKEREEYRYLDESSENKKLLVDYLYIEGDGVRFRTLHDKGEKKQTDYAHFIVHTGTKEKYKGRASCLNRKEFFGVDLQTVRAQVIDYIHNCIELKENAVVITNSDGGVGYNPRSFRFIAKEIGAPIHEHFIDRYHVKEKVIKETQNHPKIGQLILDAIHAYDKGKLQVALDTMEATLALSEPNELFEEFKRYLMGNFKWMKPPQMRGLKGRGIGIIESNHRKITYRAKRRGMTWSKQNMEAMGQLIILRDSG